MPTETLVDRRTLRRGPRCEPGTIRIYKSGTARISADLVKENYVCVSFTRWSRGHVTIHIDDHDRKDGREFVLWYSNGGAESPLLSLGGVLRKEIGVDPERVAGTYKVMKHGDRISFNIFPKRRRKAA